MDPTEDSTIPHDLFLPSTIYSPRGFLDSPLPSLVYAPGKLDWRLFLDMLPLAHKDERGAGAQQLLDSYPYCSSPLSRWEDGAQAIEEFDWSVPVEDTECLEATPAVTVESSAPKKDARSCQLRQAAENQNASTTPKLLPLAQPEHQPHMIPQQPPTLQKPVSPPWSASPLKAQTSDPSLANATELVEVEEIAASADVFDDSVLRQESKTLSHHPKLDALPSADISDEQDGELKAPNSQTLAAPAMLDEASPIPRAQPFNLAAPDLRAPTEASIVHKDTHLIDDSQTWDSQLQQAVANRPIHQLPELSSTKHAEDVAGARSSEQGARTSHLAINRPRNAVPLSLNEGDQQIRARASDVVYNPEDDMRDTAEPMSRALIKEGDEEDEVYETASDSTPQPTQPQSKELETTQSEQSQSDQDTVRMPGQVLASAITTSKASTVLLTMESHAATAKNDAPKQAVTDARNRNRSVKTNASSDTEEEAPAKKKSRVSSALSLEHVAEAAKEAKVKHLTARLKRLEATKSPKGLSKGTSKESLSKDQEELDMIEVRKKEKPVRKPLTKTNPSNQTNSYPEDEACPAPNASKMELHRDAEVVAAPANDDDYDMQERYTDAQSTPSHSGTATPNSSRPSKNHVSHRELTALGSTLAPGMHLGLHLAPTTRVRKARDDTPVSKSNISDNSFNLVEEGDDGDEVEIEVEDSRGKKKRASSSKRTSQPKKPKIAASKKMRAARGIKAEHHSRTADADDDDDSYQLFPDPKIDTSKDANITTPTSTPTPTIKSAKPKPKSNLKKPHPTASTSTVHTPSKPSPTQQATSTPTESKTPLVKNKYGFSPLKNAKSGEKTKRTTTRAKAREMEKEGNIGKRLRSKD